MSDQLIHDSEAPEGASKYSIADLRAMKSIGRPIPDTPQETRSRFIFKTKIVDEAPGQQDEKPPSKLSRWMEKLKSSSPAERAYEKADVQLVEGKYYSLSPEGQVIETTITRRPMVTKTEMLFGSVTLNYLTETGQRY